MFHETLGGANSNLEFITRKWVWAGCKIKGRNGCPLNPKHPEVLGPGFSDSRNPGNLWVESLGSGTGKGLGAWTPGDSAKGMEPGSRDPRCDCEPGPARCGKENTLVAFLTLHCLLCLLSLQHTGWSKASEIIRE